MLRSSRHEHFASRRRRPRAAWRAARFTSGGFAWAMGAGLRTDCEVQLAPCRRACGPGAGGATAMKTGGSVSLTKIDEKLLGTRRAACILRPSSPILRADACAQAFQSSAQNVRFRGEPYSFARSVRNFPTCQTGRTKKTDGLTAARRARSSRPRPTLPHSSLVARERAPPISGALRALHIRTGRLARPCAASAAAGRHGRAAGVRSHGRHRFGVVVVLCVQSAC